MFWADYVKSTVIADDLVMQRARSSAARILTIYKWACLLLLCGWISATFTILIHFEFIHINLAHNRLTGDFCREAKALLTSVWNQASGPWFNIKMSSYQYRKTNCGDKTILRLSYLHNRISYTGKMTSLYWIRALVAEVCFGFHQKKVVSLKYDI